MHEFVSVPEAAVQGNSVNEAPPETVVELGEHDHVQKKKKKRKLGIDEHLETNNVEETTIISKDVDGEVQGETGEQPKFEKKKKKKKANAAVDPASETTNTRDKLKEGLDTVGGPMPSDAQAGTTRKTKKAKRKLANEEAEEEQVQEDAPAHGAADEAGDVEGEGHERAQEPNDRPRSKKKRRARAPGEKEAATEGDAANGVAGCEVGEEAGTQAEFEQKDKKKRKKGDRVSSAAAGEEEHAGVPEGDGINGQQACHDVDDVKVEEKTKKKAQRERSLEAAGGTEEKCQEREPPCLKVFVANLPRSMGKGLIWKHFERCGQVEDVFLLKDWWTGASRGVCFVTFRQAKGARRALKLDGTDDLGQKIRVDKALDKQKEHVEGGDGEPGSYHGQKGQEKGYYGYKGSKGGEGKGKGKGKGKAPAAMFALGDKPAGCLGLLCRGLSFAVTEADLAKAFEHCGGGPTRIRLLVDAGGESKGKAFLDFADEAAVDEAIKLCGTKLKGRKLCVEYLRQRAEP